MVLPLPTASADPSLRPGLVLEYLAGGTLGAALGLTTGGPPHGQMLSAVLMQLAADVACGLHFLHSHSIIHCDVKSSNVLLDTSQPPRAKLCDFGISVLRRPMDTHESPTGATCFSLGTPRYQAPEITTTLAKIAMVQGVAQVACGPQGACAPQSVYETDGCAGEAIPLLPVHAPMDVYAFGLLLYEILHGHVAFEGQSPVAAMLRASRGERPQLALRPEHAYLAQLIERCWDAEPARRPSMHEVLKVIDPVPDS